MFYKAPTICGGFVVLKHTNKSNFSTIFNRLQILFIKAIVTYFILFLSSSFAYGNADSLYNVYKRTTDLKQKTEALLKYADQILHSDIDSAIVCGQIAMKNAKHLKNEMLIAEAHILMGYGYEALANYKESLTHFLKATEISKKLNNKAKLAQCYTAMGVVYWYQGFYEKAEEYYKKNIVICKQLGDIYGMGASYGNLAILFDEKKDLESALLYYQKALEIFDPVNKPRQRAACLDNMSLIYKQKKEYKYALLSNKESYKIRESLQDTIGMLASMNNLASIYRAQGKLQDAISLSERVLNLSTRIGSKQDIKAACINLRDAYEEKKDYKSANAILNKLMSLNDSIRNSETVNEIAELEAKFKTKEKEVELSEIKLVQQLKEKENAEELKRKNYFIIILSFIGALVVCIAVLLLKRFKEKKLIAEEFSEKNKAIEMQKTIIDKAFHQLSEKNKDITDSIKYAKRIQKAIFPTVTQFSKLLPKSFVFFKPKDIVSGDFYWVEEHEGEVYLAVVDCTGHGVPGAFMSIVGFNLLNKAIHENKCNTPADILNQVNIDLNETLKETMEESAIKDGMEISLCKWNKKTNEFLFAGANTIIYHVSNNQLEIIKGDKQPIGSFYGEKLKPFTNILINIKPEDCLYLFSDGYADQFGGIKGKKYKYKQLEDFLLKHSNHSMAEQRQYLSNEFTHWKGDLEQVDDVCVLGLKF